MSFASSTHKTHNMSLPLLSGKVFLLITGASRGIGQQRRAESFGALLDDGSLVLLIARNADGLKGTASKIPKEIKVETTSVDLSIASADQYRGILVELKFKKYGKNCSVQINVLTNTPISQLLFI